MKRRSGFLFFLLFFCLSLSAQDTLLLSDCYTLARQHYPLLQRDSLLQEKMNLALDNLDKSYLPQLSLQAKASYQSAVTTLPVDLPGLSIPQVNQDQYRATVELRQLLFDGGRLKGEKSLQKNQTALNLQAQRIIFHQLKQQLNQRYATLLILQAQTRVLALQKENIQEQLRKMTVARLAGTALPSQADELRVALLQTGQQINDLLARREAESAVLALLIGKPVTLQTPLAFPAKPAIKPADSIRRPELKQFTLQQQTYALQSDLVQRKRRPQLSAFVQGGYGRPGLNMLNNDFEGFYLAGVHLQWQIFDWHQTKNQQQSLHVASQQVQLERAHFLLQTRMALSRSLADIHSLEQRLEEDAQIIQLHQKILHTAQTQLAHGVLTPTAYLIQLNATTAASLQQQIHRINLRFAQLHYHLLKK